ncbi:MAG: hypothetical protein ING69_10795 [Rhodocyclaceae bacterium]|nr:hypothetical protein [Rhodocyclaceae bacterium]
MVNASVQVFAAPKTIEKLDALAELVGSVAVAARLSMAIGSRRAREKGFCKLLEAPRPYFTGDDAQKRLIVTLPQHMKDLIDELAKRAGGTSAAARALLSVGADDVYKLLIADFKGEKR